MSPMKPITLPRWVIVLCVAGPLVFSGVGILAVGTGSEETASVCDAVQGLRDDLVSSLTGIRDRALQNADTLNERTAIREAYDGEKGLITTISNPDCP